MKHSTFRKSSLISSVALLLVAIVALSGATFAWFSSKGTATATGINATTEQGSNLVISNEQTSGWTQSLALGVNKELTPVTTNDLSVWKTANADSFNAQVPGSKGYTDASVDDYICQRIYVMYDAASGTKDVTATLTATAATGTTTNFYRVAVKPVAGVAGEDGNGLSNTETFTEAYYYSVSDKNHATYTDTEGNTIDPTWGNYTVSTVANIALGTLNAKAVYAYDVYVWFEGEDLDCIDSYSTNNVTLQIDFA